MVVSFSYILYIPQVSLKEINSMKKLLDSWFRIIGAGAFILIVLSVFWGLFWLLGLAVIFMIVAYILYKAGRKAGTK